MTTPPTLAAAVLVTTAAGRHPAAAQLGRPPVASAHLEVSMPRRTLDEQAADALDAVEAVARQAPHRAGLAVRRLHQDDDHRDLVMLLAGVLGGVVEIHAERIGEPLDDMLAVLRQDVAAALNRTDAGGPGRRR